MDATRFRFHSILFALDHQCFGRRPGGVFLSV